MPITGGDLVVETLSAAGVDTVFGIISIHNTPIYDALLRHGGIRPIMVRHEQAALGMADGYARASGQVGVAITSTGPGAANGMGALVEAYTAGSPLLEITGNIEKPYLGKAKGFIHEVKDQLAMLRTNTKWAATVESCDCIPDVLSEAIRQARSGRQRPTAVEIPIDLQFATCEAVLPPDCKPYPFPSIDEHAVQHAADLLAAGRRVLIWAGGGALASNAGPEILALARQLKSGVLTTLTGRGVISEDDPLCIGNLSIDPTVQELMAEADVLLAVGTRFQGPNTQNWRMKLPPTIIHVDADSEEFNRNYPAAVALHGDGKACLRLMINALDNRESADPDWCERVSAARDGARANQRSKLGPHAEVMDALRSTLPRDAIVVKDATVPAYTWGNRLLEVYEPRTAMSPASVAIGVGLPLALGAAVAKPDRRVVLIAGDGGFMLSCAELSTAAQYGLNITVVIFNDRGYGVLRNVQRVMFEGRHVGVDLHPVDFRLMAESMGVPARAVPKKADFQQALEWGLAQHGPAVLDVDLEGIGPMASTEVPRHVRL
jgi:acetolactate synthase-1/2/3 large subunit